MHTNRPLIALSASSAASWRDLIDHISAYLQVVCNQHNTNFRMPWKHAGSGSFVMENRFVGKGKAQECKDTKYIAATKSLAWRNTDILVHS
jgi:hypothetical protein